MTDVAPGLEGLTVPIDDLKPASRNPRRGDVDAIADSLQRHGQYRPLVVNRRTGEVLAGNHTLAAARMLGFERLAVTYVDVDADQAARIVLQDNRSNETSTYDLDALEAALTRLDDLDGTGWTPDDLELIREQRDPLEDYREADTPGGSSGGGGHPDDGEQAQPVTCPGCSHTFPRPAP